MSYEHHEERRLQREHKLAADLDGLMGRARSVYAVEALRKAVRAIEIRSRSIKDVSIKAGYLGAIEAVKLIASTFDGDGINEVTADADMARRMMQQAVLAPGESADDDEIAKFGLIKGDATNATPGPSGKFRSSADLRRFNKGGGRPPLPLTECDKAILDDRAAGETYGAIVTKHGVTGTRISNLLTKARKMGDPRFQPALEKEKA